MSISIFFYLSFKIFSVFFKFCFMLFIKFSYIIFKLFSSSFKFFLVFCL